MKGGTNEKMAKGKVRIDVNDLVGKSIGQLEVKSYGGQWYENTAGGQKLRHRYFVHCSCGVEKYVRRGQLTSEITHSCGCARKNKGGR